MGKEGDGEDPRDAAILGPALEVFGRLGYQRSSMEEVARAAGVSRAGLYLYFGNKEELFHGAVEHGLRMRLKAARAALGLGTLEMGLVGALEAWLGEYAGGLMGAETEALMVSARQVAGEVMGRMEGEMVGMLAEAVGGSELGAAYARVDVSPAELAGVLYAMGRGFRGSCGGREEFVKEMGVAVRVLFAARG